ncbi:MAG: inositol monophosphatase [Halobacteriales archaeon]|nr:inositol monophosphatase [Halobacteriales archaeon]
MTDRLDQLLSVARTGAEVASEGFQAGIVAETKGAADRIVNPGDVVTAADRDAQRAILEAIEDRFPADTIVAEEEDAQKTVPDSGAVWVIDPIDGSYNFVRGIPMWATAVALVVDGTAVGAATIAPATATTYFADRSRTTRDGTPVSVSDRTDPKTFGVAYTVVPALGERAAYSDGVKAMLTSFGDVRRIGSLHIALALVAAGGLEGVVTPAVVSPWDSIGGVHLVRQAGGVATDIDGDPWRPESTGLVVSNGTAHEELLRIGRHMAGD